MNAFLCNITPRIKHTSQLILEASKGRWTHIVCPRKTQLPLRQRRIKLQAAGIDSHTHAHTHTHTTHNTHTCTCAHTGVINVYNCRRLVHCEKPCATDQRWVFVKREDVKDMGFPDIATDWLSNFTKKWKTMWEKGAKCFWEGRAYNFRWINDGAVRHFSFQTKRTMKTGPMTVHVAFNRDSRDKWQVRRATCKNCQAGLHTGFCHHIVVGLEGLAALHQGLIIAGEVNAGKMHWGLKQCNDERAHVPTSMLSVLAGEECKVVYRGLQDGVQIVPCMQAYLEEVAILPGTTMVQQLYSLPGERRDRRFPTKRRLLFRGRPQHAKRRERFRFLVDDIKQNAETYVIL